MDTADRLLSCLSSALLPGGNNARVAETLAGELDVARSTAAAIDTVRNPDLTTGRTLDYVAQMFNVARTSGESDDSLRSRIMTQIKRYYSCGTLADIRDVIEYFTGLLGDQVRIWEPPDVHEGWGFGEGRYGALLWGTPHAMFRVELLGDHTPISLPGLVAAIDLVRAAGSTSRTWSSAHPAGGPRRRGRFDPLDRPRPLAFGLRRGGLRGRRVRLLRVCGPGDGRGSG